MAASGSTEPIPVGPVVSTPTGPSAFYRAGLWQVGLTVVRALPEALARLLLGKLSGAYAAARPARREIVVRNLLPLLDGDRPLAEATARRLFVNFGRKLGDLWRFEAGRSLAQRFVALNDWERFREVLTRRQGVLMLTPHLGNWEIGGALLVERGVRLIVVTQAEPSEPLTKLRQRSRSRWGVETLVIGRDTFSAVEIIRRLQEGACVAMLIDRPPAGSAVPIRFCGHPFSASIAPAELARASGCALVGVYIVEKGGGYCAHVLPEFTYNRPALRDREQRRQLVESIMAAFEPVIRQHADQWYHFVPIWPETPDETPPARAI